MGHPVFQVSWQITKPIWDCQAGFLLSNYQKGLFCGRSLWRCVRFYAGDDGGAGDGAFGGFWQIDAVVLHGRGKSLVEVGAVFGVGAVGGDEVVFGDGDGALLGENICSCRCAEVELLLLGFETLLVVVAGGCYGLNLGAVIGEGEAGVFNLHADLNVELLHAQFGLTVLHQRALLH